jgi:hypothetical protein
VSINRLYAYGVFSLAIGLALVHGIEAFWLVIGVGFLFAVFWRVLSDSEDFNA